jgi:hypothetical protein
MADPENALLDRRSRNALLSSGGLPSADLSPDERRVLDDQLSGRATWGALAPQSEEERRSLDWRNSPMWSVMLPPLMARQGGYDLARGIGEGDLGTGAWGAAQIAGAALPFLSGTRAARAPASATRAERGPWSSGYHEDWLANRPPPVPRHELNELVVTRQWQPDRRWGRVPVNLDNFLYPGLGRPPMTPQEALQLGARVGPAAGIGYAVGDFGSRVWLGEPWQDAAWHALWHGTVGPMAPNHPPPSWWPRPDSRPDGER